MRYSDRREMERLGVGLLLAILFHLLLFLILEYAGLIGTEEAADYIGPLFVELGDVTSIPETARIESEETKPEERSPVDVREPEEVGESSEVTEVPERSDPIEAEGEEGESEVLTSESSQSEETVPEASTEESKETYTPPPQTAPTVTDESLYEGRDAGNEVTIKMSDKSDKARPNFKIPVQLPAWVARQGLRLTVKFSFIVGTDGYITHLNVDKSSGFDEVDKAISRALLKWKFSNPFVKERIMGTFTYRINSS